MFKDKNITLVQRIASMDEYNALKEKNIFPTLLSVSNKEYAQSYTAPIDGMYFANPDTVLSEQKTLMLFPALLIGKIKGEEMSLKGIMLLDDELHKINSINPGNYDMNPGGFDIERIGYLSVEQLNSEVYQNENAKKM